LVSVASKELITLMNKGIARELQVSIQYIWQHVLVTGIKGAVVEDIFKKIVNLMNQFTFTEFRREEKQRG